jgi:hypothetical protein
MQLDPQPQIFDPRRLQADPEAQDPEAWIFDPRPRRASLEDTYSGTLIHGRHGLHFSTFIFQTSDFSLEAISLQLSTLKLWAFSFQLSAFSFQLLNIQPPAFEHSASSF